MNKLAKYLRIAVAAVSFTIITCGFLNLSGGNPLSQIFLRTQFTPALVSVFTGSAVAFIILTVITLLFGRVYCSFLCPLGIFQDIIIRISNFAKRKKRVKLPPDSYSAPHNILRYTILGIVGISFAIGFTFPLVLLDPYSNYGRIAAQIFGTVETSITNLLSGIFPTYFYVQEHVTLGLYSFIFSCSLLLVVVLMSALRGRLYCNTICPVGTFLGLLGGYSLFKPAIDKEKCVKCTLCAKNCKTNCINLETKEIDATRCVACYNCLTSCKRGGVKLVPVWFNNKHKSSYKRDIESKERRAALVAMGGFAAAVAARGLMFPKSLNAVNRNGISDNKPVMPPGAGNLTAFKDACTACHACIAACPENIIKPASFEYGIDGIMLPTIRYNNGSCRYECNTCSQTCPHGALEHISLEIKQRTRIALATYDPETCVVMTDGFKCGACSRNCPTGAITMEVRSFSEGKSLPVINESKCIGCGACMEACPAMPKAITIHGVAVQTRNS